MKINEILLATGVTLLLCASCTTDDLQPTTRKSFPKSEKITGLMKIDSTFCNVSTIVHDSISCGTETDPPPVKPSK